MKDNARHPTGFYLAESYGYCWKCGQLTPMYAFMLPTGHEEYIEDEEGAEWEEHDYSAWLEAVYNLPQHAITAVRGMTSLYYPDSSRTAGETYWMNHCQHCHAKQGDFYLFHEPGGAFWPENEGEAAGIVLLSFNEPFAALAGGLALADPDMVAAMRVESR